MSRKVRILFLIVVLFAIFLLPKGNVSSYDDALSDEVIQALIDSLSNGGIVELPAGIGYIDTTVTSTKPVILRGQGIGVTILEGAPNIRMFSFASETVAFGGGISDLTLKPQGLLGDGVYASNFWKFDVHNLHAAKQGSSPYRYGVYTINASFEARIDSVRIEDAFYGVYAGANGTIISNSDIVRSGVEGSAGIYIAAPGVKVYSNWLEVAYTGTPGHHIIIDSAYAQVYDNTMSKDDSMLIKETASYFNIHDNFIEVSGEGNIGIETVGQGSIGKISDNIFSLTISVGQGQAIKSTWPYATVSDNTIFIVYGGRVIEVAGDFSKVSGNNIIRTRQTGPVGTAIYISGFHTTISDNTASGNISVGIELAPESDFLRVHDNSLDTVVLDILNNSLGTHNTIEP